MWYNIGVVIHILYPLLKGVNCMGYKQVGIAKNGKKKYKITIELGEDILGKRQRLTRSFTGTLAEVKIRDAELTKQYYHKGNKANVKELTFQQYSEIYIDKHCKGNIGLVTINNYKRLLKCMLPLIGSYKLNKITPAMLDTMYQKLRKGQKGKELSYNSMYDYYKLINAMYNQAIKWEFIDRNPNLKAHKPKKDIIERKFYDLEQINELYSCLENECIKYKALIRLAVDSGARRGEISALRWSDINFDTRTLKIDNSLKVVKGVVDEKKAKTNSSNRVILLSEATLEIMKAYKEWQDNYIIEMGSKWKGTDRIFTDDYGEHMNPSTCYKIFTKITKKYGLEQIRFHDIRHTSASLMISKGVNIKAVSERLGHSSINITSDIYAHTFESDKIKCANVFDEIAKNI